MAGFLRSATMPSQPVIDCDGDNLTEEGYGRVIETPTVIM
jgi:hypothetical protein